MPQPDNIVEITLEESTDSMGRRQRFNNGQREQYHPGTQEWEPVDDSNMIWFDNFYQFSRLLAEIAAVVGLTETQWYDICESMGLESYQLSDLFDRAQSVFECEKNLNFNVDHRWVVQHEFDGEPTYVVDTTLDPDGNNAIQLEPALHPLLRIRLAKTLALILNTDARTGPEGIRGIYDLGGTKPKPVTDSSEG